MLVCTVALAGTLPKAQVAVGIPNKVSAKWLTKRSEEKGIENGEGMCRGCSNAG
jgi:hypothetical protein